MSKVNVKGFKIGPDYVPNPPAEFNEPNRMDPDHFRGDVSDFLADEYKQSEEYKRSKREKRTYDLSKVLPIDCSYQQVILKALLDDEGHLEFKVISHKRPAGRVLNPSKSLRLAMHSTELGVTGPSLLQLSLSICLELYSVSEAVRFYKAFAGRYLIDLPANSVFTKTLIVPL